MAVEHMDRSYWLSLSATLKATWEQRLLERWKVPLTEVYDFWIEGDEVVGVRVWKRSEEGYRVHALGILGRNPATETFYVSQAPNT